MSKNWERQLIYLKKIAKREIRKDPLGGKHWRITSKVIDLIIKSKLPDSFLLTTNPRDWIAPLFNSYFLFRTYYWFIIYQTMIKRNTFFQLMRWDKLKTPIYIRLISLLLRIILDRIGIPEYDFLPHAPIAILMEPQLKSVGPMIFISEELYRYIDKITNGVSKNISDFLLKTCYYKSKKGKNMATLTQNYLLPVPTSFIYEYIQFAKEINEKYEKILKVNDLTYKYILETLDGHYIPVNWVVPDFVVYTRKKEFKNLLIDLISSFVRDIFVKLSTPSDTKQIRSLCDFYIKFFEQSPGNMLLNRIDYSNMLTELSNKSLSTHIFSSLELNLLTIDPVLADVTNAERIFAYSLDLFERPFVVDREGTMYFSYMWLYDSLISKLTYFLRNKRIGEKRGFRAENYVGYLIKVLGQNKLNLKLDVEPFKLILMDKNYSDQERQFINRIFQNYNKNFKFKIIKVIVSEGIKTFVEFDLLFVLHNILFVLEIKDNLFWYIRDLPPLIICWAKNINRKLKQRVELLKRPDVQQKLHKRGIDYNTIEYLTIMQGHIIHPEIHTLYDFFTELKRIDYKIKTGKNDTPIILLDYPRYPY